MGLGLFTRVEWRRDPLVARNKIILAIATLTSVMGWRMVTDYLLHSDLFQFLPRLPGLLPSKCAE